MSSVCRSRSLVLRTRDGSTRASFRHRFLCIVPGLGTRTAAALEWIWAQELRANAGLRLVSNILYLLDELLPLHGDMLLHLFVQVFYQLLILIVADGHIGQAGSGAFRTDQ